jgi:hypothetical protein
VAREGEKALNFRGNTTSTTNNGLPPDVDNGPLEAAPEHPPALKMAIGITEFVWGIGSNIVQCVTSTVAMMSMVIGAATVSSEGPGDLIGSFPWAFVIGFGIACSIQLFLHKNAQSMSGTWNRLRQIQHFQIRSTHALSDIQKTITINSVYFFLALIADIVSDATFVNLFTHNAYVILFWIVFLTGSSTILMYDGATRVWGAVEDYKDYKAYHDRYDRR